MARCLASSRSRSWCSASAPRWSWTRARSGVKSEFAGVKRSYLPLQSIIRIDEVRKQGVSKIVALEGGNVAPFPMPLLPPSARRSGAEEALMLELPGSQALSPISHRPTARAPAGARARGGALQAQFLHFVDCERALDARERARLEQLLDDGGARGDRRRRAAASPAARRCELLVVPRPGTISPWSSKATDIAHVCGLAAVRRIERGVLYTLGCSAPCAAGSVAAARRALHDRMIEAVLERLWRRRCVCSRPSRRGRCERIALAGGPRGARAGQPAPGAGAGRG